MQVLGDAYGMELQDKNFETNADTSQSRVASEGALAQRVLLAEKYRNRDISRDDWDSIVRHAAIIMRNWAVEGTTLRGYEWQAK